MPRKNGKGNVKRVVTILAMLVVAGECSVGQITHLGGELRYEHEYQDMLYLDQLSTSLRSNPIVDLALFGYVLSPRIIDWNVRSSMNLSFGTSQTRENTTTNQQAYYNAYDADMNFFEYSPVKFELAARDHIVDTKADYNSLSGFHGRVRAQEQRARFAVDRISYLPSVTLNYIQDRTWSLTADQSEQLSRQFTFSVATAAAGSSSINLSGAFTNTEDKYTGFEDHIATVELGGTKQLSEHDRFDLAAEYYRYNLYGTLTGSLGYIGTLGGATRITTSVSGSHSGSAYSSNRVVGAGAGLTVILTPVYQTGVSLGVSAGKYTSLLLGVSTYSRTFEPRGFLQQTLNFGRSILSDNLWVSYSLRDYGERFLVWEGGLANSLTTSIGAFGVSANYDFSAQSTRNSTNWTLVSNMGGISASGNLARIIHSQSSLQFRSDIYSGVGIFNTSQQNLNLTQGFDAQTVWYIPMTLGAGLTANWYFSTLARRTYGWYATFTSPSLFVRNLYATYRYARNYDPYYQRELSENNGSMHYQWRMVIMELRFRLAYVPNRIRDITFTISRPF
jgi:hypothetical protein